MAHFRKIGGLLLGMTLSWAVWASPSAADEPVPAAHVETAQATVATVTGTNVNVRVGPRVDGAPVLKLQPGDVVLIVERVPDWFGVRVPKGLPAAVASRYVRKTGPDTVQVRATNLNLRTMPPTPKGTMGPAYRDHPEDGETLTLIREDGDWTWVIAPETVRAYVHARYVKELGPVAEHTAVVEKARAERAAWIDRLSKNRLSRRIAAASDALCEAIGVVQESLYDLRMRGGYDRAPIAALGNTLDAAREKNPLAPARLRQLAQALRADLASEDAIRAARRDAEVAKARGLSPDPEKLPAPKVSSATLRGVLRWEAVPRWRNGGAWILWSQDRPTHVVRLTTGMPLPHPNLKEHADEHPRTVRGSQPGERLFGLPVIDLQSIER